MLIYNLDIEYGFGDIKIQTKNADAVPKTDVQNRFHMETTYPQLDMQNELPRIKDIDIYDCRTEMDQPGPEAAALIWRDEAKAYVMNYLEQKAQIGDMLGAIEKDFSIGDAVEAETFPGPPELGIDSVPKTPPKIYFQMGKANVRVLRGKTNIDILGRPVNMKYFGANVNISMDKNPYIKITAVPVGKNVDKLI